MPAAARVGDNHQCPQFAGPVPHVGGPILPSGSPDIEIDCIPAARTRDQAACAVGGPDVLAMGCPTVLFNSQFAVRVGDLTAHGGVVLLGSGTVDVGLVGDGAAIMAIAPAPPKGKAKGGSDSGKLNSSPNKPRPTDEERQHLAADRAQYAKLLQQSRDLEDQKDWITPDSYAEEREELDAKTQALGNQILDNESKYDLTDLADYQDSASALAPSDATINPPEQNENASPPDLTQAENNKRAAQLESLATHLDGLANLESLFSEAWAKVQQDGADAARMEAAWLRGGAAEARQVADQIAARRATEAAVDLAVRGIAKYGGEFVAATAEIAAKPIASGLGDLAQEQVKESQKEEAAAGAGGDDEEGDTGQSSGTDE